MQFGDSVAGGSLNILDIDWTMIPPKEPQKNSKDWGNPCLSRLPSGARANGLPGPGGKADLFPFMKTRTLCTMAYAMQ